MANWYVQVMGEVQGPFQDGQLKAMADSKRIDRETPVRCETTGTWTMAGSIKGLFSASAPTPPPRQSALPVAIPVAAAPVKSRKWLWILLAGFFGLPIAMCSGCLMLAAVSQASRESELNRPAPENYSHLQPGPLSYSELVYVSKGLTDSQWELYAKSLTGKRARWDGGWIKDVETNYDGSAEIQIDYDQPGRGISIHEVVIPAKLSVAAKYSKGDPIDFDGEIASVTKFLGKVLVKIKPAAIINDPAKLTPIVIPKD
jgi:hypothetical protein